MALPSMMPSQLEQKVKEYEHFVNDVLKVDLFKSTELQARHEVQLQEWTQLERDIKLLQEVKEGPLNTLVELGAGVHCQAQVNDTKRIFVSIGLGFHLECSLEEALQLINSRKELIQAKIDEVLVNNAKIKSKIKFFNEALAELMKL